MSTLNPGPVRPSLAIGLVGVWLAACLPSSDSSIDVTTPLSRLEQVFGPDFFDLTRRTLHLTLEAQRTFELPEVFGRDRYRFLGVTDLRRIDGDHREAVVDVSIDRWPLSVGVSVGRVLGEWKVTGFEPLEHTRWRLRFLDQEGLPRAGTARPLQVGLDGRDAAGRPSAVIVLLADGETLAVDGRQVENSRDAVVERLREAIALRQRLAEAVHAQARAQAGLGLRADEVAGRLPVLLEWARAAGLNEAVLLVRAPDGSPAYLPLPRIEEQPPGRSAPPTITCSQELDVLVLEIEGQRATVPISANGPIDARSLEQALAGLRRTHGGIVGIRLPLGLYSSHGHTAALLDALRAAAPELPVLPVLPSSDMSDEPVAP